MGQLPSEVSRREDRKREQLSVRRRSPRACIRRAVVGACAEGVFIPERKMRGSGQGYKPCEEPRVRSSCQWRRARAAGHKCQQGACGGRGGGRKLPQFCRTLVRTASCLFQGFFSQKPGNLYTPFSKQECSVSVAAFSSVAVTVSSLF